MKPAELIIDGKNTFPLLFEEIERCEKTIYIRMFIWRNDAIGKELARRLLAAADRGVKIILIKDRYGLTCEYIGPHREPAACEPVRSRRAWVP